jgi:hypothetical protein
MDEDNVVKVEVKQPETDTQVEDKGDDVWMKIGLLTAKVEQLEKDQQDHKTWLERLSHDADDAQKQSLLLHEELKAALSEVYLRLAELEAMEVIEEIAETEPEPEVVETEPEIVEENPEPDEAARKRPSLIV